MSDIDVSDIQGFSLKGYNFPHARYLLLELLQSENARKFVELLLPVITTGERWENNQKPLSVVNLAFTYTGLVQLQLPEASLLSFPLEFQQGMKARGDILYDSGKNAPEYWDPVWNEGRVHAWLAVNALAPEELEKRCAALQQLMSGNRRGAGAASAGCQRRLSRRQAHAQGTLRLYGWIRQSGFQRRGSGIYTGARQIRS